MADTFTVTQVVSNTLTINDRSKIFDGHCYSDGYNLTGSMSSLINSRKTIVVGKRPNDGYLARGYVEWDISSIPDNANITQVKFIYEGNYNNTDGHILSCLTTQPSSTSEGSGYSWWYDELDDGTTYADVAGFPVVGTNQVITLGNDESAQACIDLENQLSSDWFAIALVSDDETVIGAEIVSEHDSAANPPPSIYISYAVTLTATLNQPRHITYSNMRKMEKHLFPDGTFKQHDIGAGGKTVVLEGCETTDAKTTMQTIDSMMNNGEKITVSDMDYDDLNTDWYIKGFRWEQREGYVNIYDWQLTLVEA